MIMASFALTKKSMKNFALQTFYRGMQILICRDMYGQNGNVFHILRNYLGNALLATSKCRKFS